MGGVMGIAVLIGRSVAGCLGATLIYSALFLYKEEEGGLENRMEQWWRRIRDLHGHTISRETAFLKVVADITSKGFAKLFGERLFGLTAVAASICYSQAAAFLLMLFDARLGIQFICGILFLVFLLLGSLGPDIERQSQKRLWLSSVLIVTASWPIVFMAVIPPSAKWYAFPPSAKFLAWQGYYEGVTILIGVVCDFLFIALTRVMLARAAQSNSFIKIAGLAIGNACLATLLFIAPLVGSFQLSFSPAWLAANTLYLVAASNFLDALLSLTWFLIERTLSFAVSLRKEGEVALLESPNGLGATAVSACARKSQERNSLIACSWFKKTG